MEQHRTARAVGTGDPRGNPLTSDIVRHDFHIRGIEHGSPCWEARTTAPSSRIRGRNRGIRDAILDFPYFPKNIPFPLKNCPYFPSAPGGQAVVTDRLACSPPTKANRTLSPAGLLPDFREWESCRTLPLVGGFSRRSRVSASFHSSASPYNASPSSALKTAILRSAQISSLTSEHPGGGGGVCAAVGPIVFSRLAFHPVAYRQTGLWARFILPDNGNGQGRRDASEVYSYILSSFWFPRRRETPMVSIRELWRTSVCPTCGGQLGTLAACNSMPEPEAVVTLQGAVMLNAHTDVHYALHGSRVCALTLCMPSACTLEVPHACDSGGFLTTLLFRVSRPAAAGGRVRPRAGPLLSRPSGTLGLSAGALTISTGYTAVVGGSTGCCRDFLRLSIFRASEGAEENVFVAGFLTALFSSSDWLCECLGTGLVFDWLPRSGKTYHIGWATRWLLRYQALSDERRSHVLLSSVAILLDSHFDINTRGKDTDKLKGTVNGEDPYCVTVIQRQSGKEMRVCVCIVMMLEEGRHQRVPITACVVTSRLCTRVGEGGLGREVRTLPALYGLLAETGLPYSQASPGITHSCDIPAVFVEPGGPQHPPPPLPHPPRVIVGIGTRTVIGEISYEIANHRNPLHRPVNGDNAVDIGQCSPWAVSFVVGPLEREDTEDGTQRRNSSLFRELQRHAPENCLTGQQHAGVPSANQRLVTYLPSGSRANRVFLAACRSSSHFDRHDYSPVVSRHSVAYYIEDWRDFGGSSYVDLRVFCEIAVCANTRISSRRKHWTPCALGAMRHQACVFVSPVLLPRFLTLDAQVHTRLNIGVLKADEGETEMRMEQRRNGLVVGGGGQEITEKTHPTSGIVHHDSHMPGN
ncbi:hypothetical protein PR048_004265 [Dryococelus australis]|uniref:Uncharacterized protein n=1 Tax=Dryococelus australis TaxID=614101 RepID=A0ABQ9I610_9NEOP|nr:hypothetical protein PR048_004265 [Dryococelus australis]